jgi:hypothetical protein
MRHFPFYFSLLLVVSSIYICAQDAAPTRAVVEGKVVASGTGAPIAGARVKLELQTEPIYTRTDAEGHFLFQNLAPALYFVSVESPGFLALASTPVDFTLPRSGGTGGGGRRVIEVPNASVRRGTVARSTDPDGTLRATVSAALTAYAAITGRVTDPDGLPLEDCPVEIMMKRPLSRDRGSSPVVRPLPDGKSELMQISMAHTNDKGEFRAGRLEPGTYYVVANKVNFPGAWESTYQITYYPRAIDLMSAKPLDLAAGQQVRADIQIASQNGVRVAGRLIKPGAAEEPAHSLLYTSVALVPEQNYLINSNGPFTTGRDDYALTNVLPGRYTLMALTRDASADPFGGSQKAVFGLTRSIEIGDRDMEGVDLVLQPLHDLAGTVTFREGCTPSPIHIRAQSFSNPLGPGPGDAVSGSDGKFVLKDITVGRYTVSVSSASGPGFGRMVPVSSIRLGDRDVREAGFEAPLSGEESLHIDIGCNTSGGQR